VERWLHSDRAELRQKLENREATLAWMESAGVDASEVRRELAQLRQLLLAAPPAPPTLAPAAARVLGAAPEDEQGAPPAADAPAPEPPSAWVHCHECDDGSGATGLQPARLGPAGVACRGRGGACAASSLDGECVLLESAPGLRT
jgi:hypothetical protein